MSKTIRIVIGAVSLAVLAWVAVSYVSRPHVQVGETIGDFTLSNAYARGGAKPNTSGAVFFMLTNNGSADQLIGASYQGARKTELHTHLMTDDGIMQMRPIEGGVAIGAGQTIMFKRGGDHVMIMGVSDIFVQDGTMPLTLKFKNAGDVTFTVTVDNNRKPSKHAH